VTPRRLPATVRLALRLHRLLLRLFSGRFPEAWADDAHATAWSLVERSLERGALPALATALAECGDVARLGCVAAVAELPQAVLRDVRHTLRRMLERPLRAVSVIAMLGVGVGASTAVFSVVNNTLLRPMMLRDIATLVRIDDVAQDGTQVSNVSPLNADRLERRAATLDPVVVQDYRPFVLTGDGEPERLRGAGVSEGFARGLGVSTVLGRVFTEAEHRTGEEAGTVMVSWNLWQRHWGGDPHALGAVAVLNGRPRTVVGVMPRGFHFPYEADVWVPLDYEPTQADPHYLLVFGRIAPGRGPADVQRELDAISVELREAAPRANRGVRLRAMPLRDNLVRGYDRTALALLSVVGFLLLVGAVNVAGLGLAEAQARAREMAVRAALGATRRRQIAQLLVESATLALLGGAVGVALAALLRPFLSLLVPPVMSVELAQDDIVLDRSVLLFALAASTLAALVAGVFPAVRAAVRDPAGTLRAGGPVRRGGQTGSGLLLVGLELAFTMVLVTGAGAVTAAFVRSRARPLGYHPEGVLTLRASLPEDRYPGERGRVDAVDEIRRALQRLPGVSGAAAATGNPGRGGWTVRPSPTGADDAGVGPESYLRFVTPGFRGTLGLPLLAGRSLDARDERGPLAAVVSARLARALWGEERAAVGRTLALADAPAAEGPWTVVGVYGDLREEGDVATAVYLPYSRHVGRLPGQEVDLFVRASGGDAAAVAPAVRTAVHEVDPDLALYGVQPQTAVRSVSVALERAGATLAAGFVAFGLLLSAIGVFGVASTVAGRSLRAVGVRKALGAGPVRLLASTLAPTLRAVASGVAVGAAAAWVANRLLRAGIAGLPAPDPLLIAGAAVLLTLVALAAALVPLVAAARTDAARVLRAD